VNVKSLKHEFDYVPGERFGNWQKPLSFDCVRLVAPVDIGTALTSAPGITEPDASVVVPEMAAVFRWPKSVSEEHRKKHNTMTVSSLKRHAQSP
jgi:hypothetical protein